MSSLPTLGTLSYGPANNVFTFPVETETLGFKAEPIFDSSRRTFVGNRYELHIRTLIAAAGSVDSTVASLRNVLMRPGQVLNYTGHGHGNDLVVNGGSGGKYDIAYGPFPRSFSTKILGGNLAIQLDWTVEFTLLDCNQSSAPPWFKIMEFCFTVNYSQDANRLTRRIYRGHLKIPNNRLNGNSARIIDSPDNYYEKVMPALLYGFRRESEDRTVSEDRTRLDFSATDVQMEYAPPPGVLDWTFRQSAHNSSGGLASTWVIAFNAHYKMAMNFSPGLGAVYFAAAVTDRLGTLIGESVATGPPVVGGKPSYAFVPIDLVFSEDVKNRSGDFSAVYSAVLPLQVAVSSGFWRPLPGHEFRMWRQSMSLANAPRGYTQEKFTADQDVIIDLCANGNANLPQNIPVQPTQLGLNGFPCPPCPDPDTSFLWWQCAVHLDYDQGTVDHMPLPSKPLPPPQPSLVDQLFPNSTAGQAASQDPNAQPAQQQRVSPRAYVILEGYAVRACYPIGTPKLQSVGGQQVLPANRPNVEYVRTVTLPGVCVPLVISRWSQRYLVTSAPASLSTGGGGGAGVGGGPAPRPLGGGFNVIAPGQGIQGAWILPS